MDSQGVGRAGWALEDAELRANDVDNWSRRVGEGPFECTTPAGLADGKYFAVGHAVKNRIVTALD